MKNLTLWNYLKEMKSPQYRWVDLTHELSSDTPHWAGFGALKDQLIFSYDEADLPSAEKAPFITHSYSLVGQYGTHVDVPCHFSPGGRTMEEIKVEEMIYPLVVIDKSKECAKNPEFMLTQKDLEAWEKEHGRIPDGAFVAFRSDWYKKEDLDNLDADGHAHYPGWDVGAIAWLIAERNIGAIGHEPADTDPSTVTSRTDAYPFPSEKFILDHDRIQIEVLAHLDELPATGSIMICAFPKLKDGTGFSARCFAICPAE